MAQTYTVKQVADILGYSTNSIYSFLKEKRIKAVRVGKGRFRIPESELERLLLLSKKDTQKTRKITDQSTLPQDSTSQMQRGSSVIDKLINSSKIISPFVMDRGHKVTVPRLLDWFVGLSSIVLGFSMFVYSKSYDEFAAFQLSVWLPTLRIIFIASGSGVLLTDITGYVKSIWHKIFLGLLLFAFGILSIAVYLAGDYIGLLIYSLYVVVMVFSFVVKVRGVINFLLYPLLFLLLLPFFVNVSGSNEITDILASYYLAFPNTFLWVILAMIIPILVIYGYMKNRKIFLLGISFTSVVFVLLSFAFVREIYWGRSFLMLLTSLVTIFVLVWEQLVFLHKKHRKLVFSAFGLILLVFLSVTWVVKVLQSSILDFTLSELTSKNAYAKLVVESSFNTAVLSLENVAKNPSLITSLKSGNQDSLKNINRTLYESSPYFKRSLISDPAGKVIEVYPLEEEEGDETVAMHEYFVNAVTRKSAVISENMRLVGIDEGSVPIAVPVMDKKEVVGVIVGFVDMDEIDLNLQQIANSSFKEYMVMIDNSGKYMIHPDRTKHHQEAPRDGSLIGDFSGKVGKGEVTKDGVQMLVSYDTIEKYGWTIATLAPLKHVIDRTHAPSVVIFFLIIVLTIILLGLLFRGTKRRVPIEDSS